MDFLLDGQSKFSVKTVSIGFEIELYGVPAVLEQRIKTALERCRSHSGTVTEVRFEQHNLLNKVEGAYHLKIEKNKIRIQAMSEVGLFYGGQTLLRCLERNILYQGMINDFPLVKLRGFKLYLPSPDLAGMKAFCETVDFLARHKYNFLMLEVGGAMEFLSHPEINRGWEDYCQFMNEYPGKPQKIQHQFPWRKNSIHSTNGGGKVVSQSMVREMIDYCRKRHFEVVPEMPSLSHCDYLLPRHHELAERQDDPYPDTCCPNHPDYYPLLFELFDEIIEVFQPRSMHIGHDEYYSIGICSRCCKKESATIYADDIKKCVKFLRTRNVKTMIWGDKLLNAHFPNGEGCGGAEIVANTSEHQYLIPATWPAIDQVPRDLQIMHWYWSIDRNLENEFVQRDMSMIFGNFYSRNFPELRRRLGNPVCEGVCLSNWGATDNITLQRNGMYFDIVSTAAWLWNPQLDSADYPRIRDWALAELFTIRHPGKDWLEVVHTCFEKREYKLFFDGWFVDEQKDLLGWHQFRDEQGNKYDLPVIYGSNISSDDVSFERNPINKTGRGYDTYSVDMRLLEVSTATLPEKDTRGRTWYRCRYPHPAPERTLTYCCFIPVIGFSGSVKCRDIN